MPGHPPRRAPAGLYEPSRLRVIPTSRGENNSPSIGFADAGLDAAASSAVSNPIRVRFPATTCPSRVCARW